jgi:hypothetical protein
MTDLNKASTKEVLEYLLVGHTHEELVELLKEIQDDWDKLSASRWIKRMSAIRT